MKIERITKHDAIEALKAMGLTKFSKDWKHSNKFFKVEDTWNNTLDPNTGKQIRKPKAEREADRKLWRKFNNMVMKIYAKGGSHVERIKKDALGYVSIHGLGKTRFVCKPKSPPKKFCLKCKKEVNPNSLQSCARVDSRTGIKDSFLCSPCFKILGQREKKNFERWLDEQKVSFT